MLIGPTLCSISYRFCDTYCLLIWLPSPQWLKCKYLPSAKHLDCILPSKSVEYRHMLLTTKVFHFPTHNNCKGCQRPWILYWKRLSAFLFFLTSLLLSLIDFESPCIVSSKFLTVPINLGYLDIRFPDSHLLHHVILHSVRIWTPITNFSLWSDMKLFVFVKWICH